MKTSILEDAEHWEVEKSGIFLRRGWTSGFGTPNLDGDVGHDADSARGFGNAGGELNGVLSPGSKRVS